MADFIEVGLAVVPETHLKEMSEDDAGVVGVYRVMVPKGMKQSSMASIALDRFHETIAVDNLDDFSFYVFEPDTGAVLFEDDATEGYTNGHFAGDLEKVSEQQLTAFIVSVERDGQLTQSTIVSFTSERAKALAVKLHGFDESIADVVAKEI